MKSTHHYNLENNIFQVKKGEELLNAKGRDMPFLKLAMSKMSSIISAVIVNFAFLKPR